MKASEKQVGGSHYATMTIQPVEFIYRNQIEYLEGRAITYICRHPRKGGAEDVKKAIHMLELVLEYQYSLPLAQKAQKVRRK